MRIPESETETQVSPETPSLVQELAQEMLNIAAKIIKSNKMGILRDKPFVDEFVTLVEEISRGEESASLRRLGQLYNQFIGDLKVLELEISDLINFQHDFGRSPLVVDKLFKIPSDVPMDFSVLCREAVANAVHPDDKNAHRAAAASLILGTEIEGGIKAIINTHRAVVKKEIAKILEEVLTDSGLESMGFNADDLIIALRGNGVPKLISVSDEELKDMEPGELSEKDVSRWVATLVLKARDDIWHGNIEGVPQTPAGRLKMASKVLRKGKKKPKDQEHSRPVQKSPSQPAKSTKAPGPNSGSAVMLIPWVNNPTSGKNNPN